MKGHFDSMLSCKPFGLGESFMVKMLAIPEATIAKMARITIVSSITFFLRLYFYYSQLVMG
jgi:hypothetical protein